jgi:hypothetical protein
MPAALSLDLEIRRGETFALAVRWETEPWQYAPIASISQTAPVRINTVSPHNIPNGWSVAVVGAKGLADLNAASNPPRRADMRRATVVNATAIEFNEISATDFGAHRSTTGYLAWLTPQPLTGYTARMQIRDRPGGAVLHSMTSDVGGGILLDDVEKVIDLSIAASTTERFSWSSGQYDLELVSQAGRVTALLEGAVLMKTEITTAP